MNMNRFLVFAGDHYYPCGGWSDFQGAYSEYVDAIEAARAAPGDWSHIVDIGNDNPGKIVWYRNVDSTNPGDVICNIMTRYYS